uniref:ATP synthase subunit 8 n=1 Tax=Thrips major TaxID=670476 RepID=UPI0030DE733C
MPQILPMSIPFMFTILILSLLMMISINELSWKNCKKSKIEMKMSKTNKFFLSLFIS